MTMHPDQLLVLSTLRTEADRAAAATRRGTRRPRPPGRPRRAAAALLLRLAGRLAGERQALAPQRA